MCVAEERGEGSRQAATDSDRAQIKKEREWWQRRKLTALFALRWEISGYHVVVKPGAAAASKTKLSLLLG